MHENVLSVMTLTVLYDSNSSFKVTSKITLQKPYWMPVNSHNGIETFLSQVHDEGLKSCNKN